ncbi:MAG: tetratricopeptide repeat protein [Parvularculaceae bacterium]|nr:tetratricopeptide repeat protein [Parvularculaceae bacterium]
MTALRPLAIIAFAGALVASSALIGCSATAGNRGSDAGMLVDEAAADRLLAEARVLFDAGDLEGTERSLRLAIDANPFDGRAHYNLGVLALREGRFSTAAVRFERAAELMPRDARPQLGIASVLLQTGRHSAAADAFKRVLELDPSNRAASEGLVLALDLQQQEPSHRADR